MGYCYTLFYTGEGLYLSTPFFNTGVARNFDWEGGQIRKKIFNIILGRFW